MKKGKNFWEAGFASTVAMLFIILFFLVFIVMMNKIGCKYILRVKAQTWSDAIAQSVSTVSSTRRGYDGNKAWNAFSVMKDLADSNFQYGIDFNLQTDTDKILVTADFEYPWMASGSSQDSVFNFATTYPTMSVISETQFVWNGNQNLIDYSIAIPYDRNNYLEVTEQDDGEAVKELNVGNKFTRETLKKISGQLQSKDVGRYKFNGITDTWCGEVSAQTLFTEDILYLINAGSYNTYTLDELYTMQAGSDYTKWEDENGWSQAKGDVSTYNAFSDNFGVIVTENGDEYIITASGESSLHSFEVLTPEGVKTMNRNGTEDWTYRIYPDKTFKNMY